jgi:hypothetical protein
VVAELAGRQERALLDALAAIGTPAGSGVDA